MENNLNTLEEKLQMLELQIQELMGQADTAQNDANGEFWKVMRLEAKLAALTAADKLIDEDAFDGIDPMNPYWDIGDTAYPQPFDIGSLTATTVVLEDNNAQDGGIWVAGVRQTDVVEDTGVVWDGTAKTWTCTISAASWLYLEIDKTHSTITLKIGTAATVPDGNEYMETWPLWKIGWDSTNSKIDTGAIIDLRNAIHVTGFV